jgi:hypothetical protein
MAYNTRAKLQQEGAWTYTIWQPVSASASDFNILSDNIVTRAAQEVTWRVGATLYATTDTVIQAIFEAAELYLGMEALCLACAAIAGSSDNADQNPPVSQGAHLMLVAERYAQKAEKLLAPYDQQPKSRRGRLPTATSTEPTAEYIPNFEADVAFEVP